MIIIYALLLNHTRLMYQIKNTRRSNFNFLGYNLNILILSYPPPPLRPTPNIGIEYQFENYM